VGKVVDHKIDVTVEMFASATFIESTN